MDFKGSQLGPYYIQNELGHGGTAIVYRATDTRTGADVALKILPPQLANDAMFLKRFIKEGKHATQLRHENIVKTYEAGEINGVYYLAMELVKGGTLAELSSKREHLFSMNENLDILSQIASALDFAHSQGFLHRDVKPSNILIGENGLVLLTDFGTAKQIVNDNTIMTGTGQRIGTPSFMSPEQITGDVALDYRTDVYSLGVIAYKLFTGRLPFVGSSQAELLHNIVYEKPLPADTLNPELPTNIVYNLNRALAKNPAERYESAGQFVASMVAGQVLISKLKTTAAAKTIVAKRKDQTRVKLQFPKFILRPILAALVIGCLLWVPSFLHNSSFVQLHTNAIAEADYLSGILMNYFDSPQTEQLWNNYGEPLITRIYTTDSPSAMVHAGLQALWDNIIHFNNPNGWIQRTWREWNRLKVADLLN